MASKRDVVQEISELRERLDIPSSLAIPTSRLGALQRDFDHIDANNRELLRYFPVALIATIESTLRLLIAELVDHGSPYLERAASLLANVKIDFDMLRALAGQRVTIGEIVSRFGSLSSLESVNAIFSTLLDQNFLESLATVQDRWTLRHNGPQSAVIVTDIGAMKAGLARTFWLRHVICHETASKLEVTREDVQTGLKSTREFLKATRELCWTLRFPTAPMTQAEINAESGRDLLDSQGRLNLILAELRQYLDEERQQEFEAVQEAWEQFREKHATYEMNAYKGGTIAPTIYNMRARDITDERAESLELELTRQKKRREPITRS